MGRKDQWALACQMPRLQTQQPQIHAWKVLQDECYASTGQESETRYDVHITVTKQAVISLEANNSWKTAYYIKDKLQQNEWSSATNQVHQQSSKAAQTAITKTCNQSHDEN